MTPDSTTDGLPSDSDLGTLGVAHLARLWARVATARRDPTAAAASASSSPADQRAETEHDRILLDGLGLSREPTLSYLWQSAATLDQFESFILEQRGGSLDPERVHRVNALILDRPYEPRLAQAIAAIDDAPPVLDAQDLETWQRDNYVVVRNAVPLDLCRAAARAVWEYLGASPDDPATWYSPRLNGIMVQLFTHPALEALRNAPRIHKAYAQLWGTADLLGTTDRCGFNPPESGNWRFPGPRLHWDIPIRPPLPFDVQGVVYLTDTAADQGAFCCVPGFAYQVDHWLEEDPSRQLRNPPDPDAFTPTPIRAGAGDLIIWDDALPHGSSPNRSSQPRIVQYVKMAPPYGVPAPPATRRSSWSPTATGRPHRPALASPAPR